MSSGKLSVLKQWVLIGSYLFIGLCIYVLFRQNVYFLEVLFGMTKGYLCQLDFSHPLPYLLVYCVPDGLWYLAILSTNDIINSTLCAQNDKYTVMLNIIVQSVPFLLEIGQAMGWCAGTFDVYDIITYLITLITYSLCTRKKSAM